MREIRTTVACRRDDRLAANARELSGEAEVLSALNATLGPPGYPFGEVHTLHSSLSMHLSVGDFASL